VATPDWQGLVGIYELEHEQFSDSNWGFLMQRLSKLTQEGLDRLLLSPAFPRLMTNLADAMTQPTSTAFTSWQDVRPSSTRAVVLVVYALAKILGGGNMLRLTEVPPGGPPLEHDPIPEKTWVEVWSAVLAIAEKVDQNAECLVQNNMPNDVAALGWAMNRLNVPGRMVFEHIHSIRPFLDMNSNRKVQSVIDELCQEHPRLDLPVGEDAPSA
jgi:hypothetical protein